MSKERFTDYLDFLKPISCLSPSMPKGGHRRSSIELNFSLFKDPFLSFMRESSYSGQFCEAALQL